MRENNQYMVMLTAMLLALVTSACSSEVDPLGTEYKSSNFLYIESLAREFDVEHTASVNVIAKDGIPWTASTSDSWITIKNTSGNVGNGKLEITVADNPNSKDRSGKVTIESRRFSGYDHIDVRQKTGYFYIDGSSSNSPSISLPKTGGNSTVEINSNVSWKIKNKPSWLTTNTDFGTPGKLDLKLNANANMGDDRSGSVVIESVLDERTITVKQGSGFSVSMSTTNYKAKGDYWFLSIYAPSSQIWTVSADKSWVRFDKTSGSGDASIKVTVPENPDLQSRSATITVKAGTVPKTIKITQEASIFNASMEHTSYLASGDWWPLKIEAPSTLSWTVSADKNWVRFDKTSGSGDASIKVTVPENPDLQSRSATITVKAGDVPKIVNISQAAGSFDVRMDNSSFAANGDDHTLYITAPTTMRWTIEADKTWVYFNKKSSTGSTTVKVTVPANPDIPRDATITVQDNASKETKKLTIKQESGIPFKITSVETGNIDYDGNIINDYGTKIYSSQTRFLKPKIYLSVFVPGTYVIYVKLYYPNGNLSTGKTSPEGYSYSNTVSLYSSTTYKVLSGWGGNDPGHYGAGTYRWEFYYDGKKLFEKTFTVYGSSASRASQPSPSSEEVSKYKIGEQTDRLNQ